MTEGSVEFQFECVEDQNKQINNDNNSGELRFGQIVRQCLRQHFPEIEELNKQQFEVIQSFVFERNDVFAILPTRFCKSLIFQLAPAIAQKLRQDEDLNPILLVICPLNSLMDSHLRYLEKHGISATCLSSTELDEKAVLKGKVSIVQRN